MDLYLTGLFSHPSHPQKITEAIEALKESDGSSRQAIAKYTERMYSNLPASHSALLTQHLKRMKYSLPKKSPGHHVILQATYKCCSGSAGHGVPLNALRLWMDTGNELM